VLAVSFYAGERGARCQVPKCKTCQPVAHILGLAIKILSSSPERFAVQLASPVDSGADQVDKKTQRVASSHTSEIGLCSRRCKRRIFTFSAPLYLRRSLLLMLLFLGMEK